MKKANSKTIIVKVSFWQKIKGVLVQMKNPWAIFGIILAIGVITAVIIIFWYSNYKDYIIAGDGIRDTMTYQGKLVNADGVPPPDGDYSLQFKIYDSLTNGNLLWTEIWDGDVHVEQPGALKVSVSDGVFTVELNSLCESWAGDCAETVDYGGGKVITGVTFDQDSYYLQVELDYADDGTFEEIFSPRKRFTATPYSMNADKLDGKDSTDFVAKSGGANALMTGSLTTTNVIDSSLVTYQQFGETEIISDTAYTHDSGPNNLSVKLVSSYISDGYLGFRGNPEYAQIDDNDLLSFGTGSADTPFTISAWVLGADMKDFIIASKGIYNTSGEYKFFIDDNYKLSAQLFDESVANAYIGRMYNASSLEGLANSWNHFVFTYNGNGQSSGIKLYINGDRVDDENKQNGSYVAMETLSANLIIGRYDTTYSLGKIDDYMIYSRELSFDEILNLYNGVQNKVNKNNYKLSTYYLSLDGLANGVFDSANLYYDPNFQQIVFDRKIFVPDNKSAAENEKNDRDYTHFTDANRILAYDFSMPNSGILNLDDITGNTDGNNGGDTTFINNGLVGYGYALNADGSYISFNDPGINTTTGTIELWSKLNNISTSETNYFVYMSDTGGVQLAFWKQDAVNLYVKVGDATAVDTTYDFVDNNWHHLALTWSAGAYKVFVDGTAVYNAAYSTLTTPTSLFLGYGNIASTSLNGSMDSVAIYNDVLTDDEILNHAKNGFSGLYIDNTLNDGVISTSLANLLDKSFGETFGNKFDPCYFQYTGPKKLSLPFSEGYGSTTTSVSNSQVATLHGSSWVNKGYNGSALSFDGIDDYLEMEDNYDLNIDVYDFAIEFWFKGNGVSNAGKKIISKRSGDTGYEVSFGPAKDSIIFFLGDGTNTVTAVANGPNNMSSGSWNHVLISFDRSGNAVMYINAWSQVTTDISSLDSYSLSNSAPLFIGKDSTGNYFNGILDGVIIYHLYDDGQSEALPQFNIYDSYARVFNAPDILLLLGRNLSNATAPLVSINQSKIGDAGIFAMNHEANTTGYPVALWNDNSYDSGGNNIYNLIYFGTTSISGGGSSLEYGNIKWDSTNSRLVFSDGIHQASSSDTNIFEGMTAIGSTTTPTEMLEVTGNITATGTIQSDQPSVIKVSGGSTPGSSCTVGDFTWDNDYLYICTATDTWETAAIAP
ncbi:MAG: LamG domain-containing protein [Candidatus Parcubacteria bacterium]|nr:LamG domain-containing protein [Candidatus Parcubacteria bacterium]